MEIDKRPQDVRIDIYRDEYKRVCDDVRSMESSNDRILAISLTALVGATVVAGDKITPMAYFAFPIISTLMLAYHMMVYYGVFTIRGYRLYLEERINHATGDSLLIWERAAIEPPSEAKPALFLELLYACIWIFATIYTIYNLWAVNHKWGVGAGLECFVLLVGIVWALISTTRRRAAFYDHCSVVAAYEKSRMTVAGGPHLIPSATPATAGQFGAP